MTTEKTDMSVLEKEYIPQSRPYSEDELEFLQNRTYSNLRLGSIYARHAKCNHCYRVKQNGRKETEILANDSNQIGNCSVCWKYKKTPNNLKYVAEKLITEFHDEFYNLDNPPERNYYIVNLEKDFYQWLYRDFS